MPTYRATGIGYHDDVYRKKGQVFVSKVVYVDRDTPDDKMKKGDVRMPSWLERVNAKDMPPPPPAPLSGEPTGESITGNEERLAKIKDAVNAMLEEDAGKENPKYWIGNGAPEISEIQNRSGLEGITAAERNTVWANMNRLPSGNTPIA